MTQEILLELLGKKEFVTIRTVMGVMNPVDLAHLLRDLPENELAVTFRLIAKEKAAEAFSYMDSDEQEALLNIFTNAEIKNILEEMYTDDVADLLEDMPANVVNRILDNLDRDTRTVINTILRYPEDSAGSIMTTEYIDLRPGMTVKDAINKIRKVGIHSETIYTCYVTQSGKLIGVVSAKDLLTSSDTCTIAELMETNMITVNTNDDKEIVADLFNKYGLPALPVVDSEYCIVGIVTFDDAFEVITDEATEDISKMTAVTPNDTPYLKTGVFSIFKSRIPWLLILMISSTFTGWIISYFEDSLAASIALTAFIPMLMGTGGNSGSQSSVTIIRALSLGQVDFKDTFGVIFKELRVAFLCGITLAAANFLKIWAVDILLLKTEGLTLLIAAVVCITLAVTVVFAKFIGCSLPIMAKKIGFDPAVMASPFITTLVDALSLLVYFKIATVMLGI